MTRPEELAREASIRMGGDDYWLADEDAIAAAIRKAVGEALAEAEADVRARIINSTTSGGIRRDNIIRECASVVNTVRQFWMAAP